MVDGPSGVGGGGDDEEQEEPSPLGAAATLAVSRKTRRERPAQVSGGGAGLRLGFGYRAVGVIVILVALAFTPVFLSGLKKTPRNMIGISYGGGPFEAAHFQRVVAPGSSLFFNGWFDPLYLYPSDQQNYIISKQVGVGATKAADSVIAPTSDRVQLEYQVAVYFKLEHRPPARLPRAVGTEVQGVHRRGLERPHPGHLPAADRERAPAGDPPLRRRPALRQRATAGEVAEGRADDPEPALDRRARPAVLLRSDLPARKKCEDPTFIVKKIDVPKSVVTAFENNRTSQIQIQTMMNQVQQRKAEAEGIAGPQHAARDRRGELRAPQGDRVGQHQLLGPSGGFRLHAQHRVARGRRIRRRDAVDDAVDDAGHDATKPGFESDFDDDPRGLMWLR